MKFQLSHLILALGAASEVIAKVSYDGAKAMRVSVGEDVQPIVEVIQQLSLPIWKGTADGIPRPNGHVDLVVPADKVAEFEDLTAAMTTEVMHEDLGLSIAEEGNMAAYAAGKLEVNTTQGKLRLTNTTNS